MGNVLDKLKRFVTNKNTVAILCVFAGILVLYLGYNWRVSSATTPTVVPMAKTALPSGHIITREDLTTIEISGTVLEKAKGIVRNSFQLIGKKVSYGNTIQPNSFFFTSDVEDANAPDHNVLANMEPGFAPIYLGVDLHTTFGNAIYPGNYIDLWFRDIDNNSMLIYGKFIQSIKVLDVMDSQSRSVFETGAESREPSYLLFAVDDETMQLIHDAQEVGTLIPVPRNKSYTANPGPMEISSQYLKNYILAQVAVQADSNVSTEDNNE